MVSLVTFWLAVLSALNVGAAIGLMVGGMNRSAKARDRAFGESECDAHYPRVDD
jgi:hypothetical protein